MKYMIAVFSSRNETLYLANMFKSSGLYADIINTPQEVGQACGISVRFDERLLTVAKNFINSKPFRSFYGFFRVQINGAKRLVEAIWFCLLS